MSDNPIARFTGGTELSLDNILQGLDNTLTQAPTVESKAGQQYLTLRNRQWVFGRENEIVPDGERLIVHPGGFTHGYIAWHGGRPEFQQMIPVTQPLSSIRLPDVSTLKAKHGIEDCRGMTLAGVDDLFGVTLVYTQNSRGGREAIEGLVRALRAEMAERGELLFPVITLGYDTYPHPEHGIIDKPIFTVEEYWTQAEADEALADTGEDAEPEPEPEPEPKPATTRRRRPAS